MVVLLAGLGDAEGRGFESIADDLRKGCCVVHAFTPFCRNTVKISTLINSLAPFPSLPLVHP